MGNVNLSSIKVVIFDMDGLMFNTEDVYRAAIEKMGMARGKVFTDEIHRRMMGRGVLEDVTVLKKKWNLSETPEQLFAERREYFLNLVDSMIRKEPGLDELIKTVRSAGLRMAVVTGSSRELAERNLKGHLQKSISRRKAPGSAAKAAGCSAFAVPNRFNKDDDFHSADAVFNSLAEIAELFTNDKLATYPTNTTNP